MSGKFLLDTNTAREYGEIKRALQTEGRLIPEKDIGIAAIAQQHDLTLATRDGHFKDVKHLTVEVW
jgi:tRNA(fMet)-specific endonuclease VapC